MRISDWSSDVCSSDLQCTTTGPCLPSNSRMTARKSACASRWCRNRGLGVPAAARSAAICSGSEEHTSELQSLMRISYAVFCLKKKHDADKEEVAERTCIQIQHTKGLLFAEPISSNNITPTGDWYG